MNNKNILDTFFLHVKFLCCFNSLSPSQKGQTCLENIIFEDFCLCKKAKVDPFNRLQGLEEEIRESRQGVFQGLYVV